MENMPSQKKRNRREKEIFEKKQIHKYEEEKERKKPSIIS